MKNRARKIHGKTMEQFIDWLEEVLIPDLKESGFTCTAEDFETCIDWMNFQADEIRDLKGE